MDVTTTLHVLALAIAATAAVTDVRRGVIPNWLTLPFLVVGPVANGVLFGLWGAIDAVAGIIGCGLVPYLLFRRGAAGGGDVKLFAALGGVVGLSVGIEAELLSFVAASLVSLGQLAWRGQLLSTLANSVFLGLNPILPAKWRREIASEAMTTVRLGSFAFAGTVLAVLLRHPTLLPGAWG